MSYVLAFDFGQKRIGVAVANLEIKISHPLSPILVKNKLHTIIYIENLVTQYNPITLVVGLPVNTTDTVNDDKVLLIKQLKNFVNKLRHGFSMPVILVDENYTSYAAFNEQLFLKENTKSNIDIKVRDGSLDSLSACFILDRYLKIL